MMKPNKMILFLLMQGINNKPYSVNNANQGLIFFVDNQIDRRSFMSIEKCKKCATNSPLEDSRTRYVNVLRTIDLRIDTYSIDI